MSHILYYGEDADVDFRGRVYPAENHAAGMYSEDVMDQEDTVYLADLEPDEYDQLSKAGVDELTPVDTFLSLNGENKYVTALYPK